MSSDMKIAFLGTGLMGSHMARNILKAGFSVAAWNRTLAKAEALRGDGAGGSGNRRTGRCARRYCHYHVE